MTWNLNIPGNQYFGNGGAPKPWPIDAARRILALYKNNNLIRISRTCSRRFYKDFFGRLLSLTVNFGFGHWATYEELPDKKLCYGPWPRSGGIWQETSVTDSDGRIWNCRQRTPFKSYSPEKPMPIPKLILPYVDDRWKENWFPIQGNRDR